MLHLLREQAGPGAMRRKCDTRREQRRDTRPHRAGRRRQGQRYREDLSRFPLCRLRRAERGGTPRSSLRHQQFDVSRNFPGFYASSSGTRSRCSNEKISMTSQRCRAHDIASSRVPLLNSPSRPSPDCHTADHVLLWRLMLIITFGVESARAGRIGEGSDLPEAR